MKFRKKPVVVEAEQFHLTEDGPSDSAWLRSVRVFCFVECPCDGIPHVHTIHNNQAVAVEDGDWILPEPDGQYFYPVKPDIFEATYEPVEE